MKKLTFLLLIFLTLGMLTSYSQTRTIISDKQLTSKYDGELEMWYPVRDVKKMTKISVNKDNGIIIIDTAKFSYIKIGEKNINKFGIKTISYKAIELNTNQRCLIICTEGREPAISVLYAHLAIAYTYYIKE